MEFRRVLFRSAPSIPGCFFAALSLFFDGRCDIRYKKKREESPGIEVVNYAQLCQHIKLLNLSWELSIKEMHSLGTYSRSSMCMQLLVFNVEMNVA